MNISSRHQTVFRIDRFVVPAASEAEFLSVVTETNAVFEGIHGCLQHHVLKQEGAPGDCNYITVVEWVSFAAIQKARKAVVAKHKAMNLDPQEMFTRLQIKAELGNYVPVAAKKATDWPHSTGSMSPREKFMMSPADKRNIEVNGLSIAFHDIGSGDPIVFLHGNPTSSFLWRNIIPHVQSLGRCIAPDLIGMGDSEKLPNSSADSYTFVENRRYLDGFFDALGLKDRVTLVLHDWGSALGFDWARRHPDSVKGIVHMEALLATMSWDDIPAVVQPRFRGVRSEQGEELVLQQNIFIEQSIVKGTLRSFTDAEMAEYRRPFLEPGEGRRPMLTWPRQLPIGGEPADVVEIFESYGAWLAASDIPKLYIRAEPGTHSQKMIEQVRAWPNQQEVTVRGIHYPQEDSPEEIGAATAAWLRGLKTAEA